MNERLKTVVQWTIYILIIVVILFTITSLLISVLAPTFFPSANIDGFKGYINTFGIVLSFLSVGLGVYSIWQAFASGKQATEMISSIHDLKQQQDTLLVTLKSTSEISSSDTTHTSWTRDDVIK